MVDFALSQPVLDLSLIVLPVLKFIDYTEIVKVAA
jgi:hypothetical protein